MADISPGSRIRHTLTGNYYYYVAPHPYLEIELIAPIDDKGEGKTFSIERSPFLRYYETAPDDIVRYGKYRSAGGTGSSFVVELVATHPQAKRKSVFGFLLRQSGRAYPAVYDEDSFRHMFVKEDNDE